MNSSLMLVREWNRTIAPLALQPCRFQGQLFSGVVYENDRVSLVLSSHLLGSFGTRIQKRISPD
jgi:hypothetical protein